MIYLDNSATTYPKPQSVINALSYAVRELGANPGRSGHSMSVKAAKAVYDVREKAAAFFGAKPENVIFTLNCTHSLNTAIKGILKKGDHVITSSLEHNSVARPIFALQS
ncbi:MAG: aminotransferase class V-fold PLP-dependent enzyme, partial [Oscillospiraceae bacterium]|nr:aminotransferase class V-fold PLP-dependent enzyme [Oscillospiraceae bacterium]